MTITPLRLCRSARPYLAPVVLLAALAGSVSAGPQLDQSRGQPGNLIVLAQAKLPEETQIARDAEMKRGPVTNLPLPRYVSLKGNEGNARRGPSLSHRIDWVFRHSGMPLRVVAEFGHWRRVEDKDGAGGWVHYALLSGVRTAIITKDMSVLYARSSSDSDVVAKAQLGAIVRLEECKPDWCEIAAAGVHGWVPKTAIWGVDPDEIKD